MVVSDKGTHALKLPGDDPDGQTSENIASPIGPFPWQDILKSTVGQEKSTKTRSGR